MKENKIGTNIALCFFRNIISLIPFIKWINIHRDVTIQRVLLIFGIHNKNLLI